MKKFLVFILASILVIFTGCSEDTNKQTQPSTSIKINSSENGSDIIQTYINQKNGNNVSKFSVEYSLELGTGLISVFKFYNHNSDEFEGIAQLIKKSGSYSVQMEDHTKVDKSSPFTVHQMSGGYFDSAGNKKTYIVISGTVNDNKISEMNVLFNDGHLSDLIIGDNRIYSCVRTDKNISIKKIVALDENGDEVYQYPPYPPKKP